MFVCQCLLVRCQSFCSLRRLVGEQTNCFVDISTQKESVAAGPVDKEPLTHYHPISVCQTESVSSASGARNGNSASSESVCTVLLLPLLGQECWTGTAVFVLVTQCTASGG